MRVERDLFRRTPFASLLAPVLPMSLPFRLQQVRVALLSREDRQTTYLRNLNTLFSRRVLPKATAPVTPILLRCKLYCVMSKDGFTIVIDSYFKVVSVLLRSSAFARLSAPWVPILLFPRLQCVES